MPIPSPPTSTRLLSAFALAAGLTFSFASANAQQGYGGGPAGRPTFSPYLNLLRGGNQGNAVLNYYGLVRPQQQFDQTSQQLGQGLQNLQYRQNALRQASGLNAFRSPGYSQLGITGHATAFMSINGSVGGAQTRRSTIRRRDR